MGLYHRYDTLIAYVERVLAERRHPGLARMSARSRYELCRKLMQGAGYAMW